MDQLDYLEIKPATEKDVKILQDLLNSLLYYERTAFDKTLCPDWPYSEEAKQKLLRAIQDDIVLIAFYDDWPVGYLIGKFHEPTANSARSIAQAQIENIFVESDWRKMGIGEELVNYFKAIVQRRGAKRLSVTVLAANEGAIKFYEKLDLLPRGIIYSKEI